MRPLCVYVLARAARPVPHSHGTAPAGAAVPLAHHAAAAAAGAHFVHQPPGAVLLVLSAGLAGASLLGGASFLLARRAWALVEPWVVGPDPRDQAQVRRRPAGRQPMLGAHLRLYGAP